MKGIVYLIGNSEDDTCYKIGMTRRSIEERLKELQTGASAPLYIVSTFESNFPYKVESILHRRYSYVNKLNEWYELSEDNVKSFQKDCSVIEQNCEILQDNPFFK